MVVFRIVPVSSIAHEPDEEVSVNSFVVMQGHEVEIVQAQNGGNYEDPDYTELPDAFRDVSFHQRSGVISLCGMSPGASLLFAT